MPTVKPSVKRVAPKTATPKTAKTKERSSEIDLTINASDTIERLSGGLRLYLEQAGFEGYIIGLTGGVDSAVAAAIAVKAVGKERVHAYCMPYKASAHTVKDAYQVADWLGLSLTEVDITSMIESYYADVKSINPVRAGNKMARERMSILFDQAFEKRLLVLGFVNRTELALGYFTWFGDGGCSIDVLGQLYKTQVKQLAHELGVPEEIQQKPPSADLWEGQQDEEELGMAYDELDRFFALVIDQGVTSKSKLKAAGYADDFIDRALAMTNKYSFKRHSPTVPALGMPDIPTRIELKK